MGERRGGGGGGGPNTANFLNIVVHDVVEIKILIFKNF
jgi:hypothetical protein